MALGTGSEVFEHARLLVPEASSFTLQPGREHSFMFTSHTYSFGDSQKEEKESSIPSSLRGCSESHL